MAWECTDQDPAEAAAIRGENIHPSTLSSAGELLTPSSFRSQAELLAMCQSAGGGQMGQGLASTTTSFPSLATYLFKPSEHRQASDSLFPRL